MSRATLVPEVLVSAAADASVAVVRCVHTTVFHAARPVATTDMAVGVVVGSVIGTATPAAHASIAVVRCIHTTVFHSARAIAAADVTVGVVVRAVICPAATASAVRAAVGRRR